MAVKSEFSLDLYNNNQDSVYVYGNTNAGKGDDTYYIDRTAFYTYGNPLIETNTVDNDTVHAYIDYELPTNLENLILENYDKPIQGLLKNGTEVKIYGHPFAYDLDYKQGDEYFGKYTGSNDLIKKYYGTIYTFGGTCGIVSVTNILRMRGDKVTEGELCQHAIDKDYFDNVNSAIEKAFNSIYTKNQSNINKMPSNTYQQLQDAIGGIKCDNLKNLLKDYGVISSLFVDPQTFANIQDWHRLINVDWVWKKNLNEIATFIEKGRGVIIGVNQKSLSGPTTGNRDRDHAITVVGVR